MSIYRTIHVFIITLFFCVIKLNAQNRTNDAVGWFSVSLEQKVVKNITARVFSRARFDDNISRLKSYYVDCGLFYNFNYKTSISLNYVYAPSKVKDDYFRTYHQYYISLNTRYYYGKYIFLSNRVIVQQTSHKFIVENGYKPYSRTDLRDKITINWKPIQGYRFYIGNEIMIPISSTPVEIRRNRVYAGVNKKIAKRLSADVYFVLQSSFHNKRKKDNNDYVYGFTINYRFNNNFDF